MREKKIVNVLCIVMNLVFLVLWCSTAYAQVETADQRQADLKNVLETESLKVWRDYLQKYKPTREEKDYTSLLSVTPDRLVVVPLEPDFALTAQEMLTAATAPRPQLSERREKILVVSYALKYGGSLWWLGASRCRPPAEFDLDIKLKVYLLNTTDGSLVSYPEQNYSGTTNRLRGEMKGFFDKIKDPLSGGTPGLQRMIEGACKEIVRIARVVNGQKAGIEENLRRQIAKLEIKEQNWKLRQRGSETLVNILKQDDIEILTELLYDKHWYVRLAVAYGLSDKLSNSAVVETFGAMLVPLFRLALLDDIAGVRERAAEGLGKTGSSEALQPLFVAAKDKDADVRTAAAVSLGQIGNQKATDVLIRLLEDENSLVDKAAVRSLEKLGWKPLDTGSQINFLLAARKTDDLAALGRPGVPLLIEALQSENIERVKTAVAALGKIGDQRAVEPLLIVLADPNAGKRAAAPRALGEIRDVRAVIPLIALLKDNNDNVRIAAVRALGEIGDDRAVKPLAERLKDANKDVSKAAAEVLAKFNWQPEDPDEKVQMLLVVGDSDSIVRMGKIAVTPLMAVLAEESEERRVEAIRILGRLGKDATAALVPISGFLRSKSEAEYIAAASALARIGDTAASEIIQKALESREKPDKASLWMRYALVQLGVQRDKHVSVLVDALSSDLRNTAAEVIRKIDLKGEEIEAIVDRLWKRLAEEDNEDVRKVIRKTIRNVSLKKKD